MDYTGRYIYVYVGLAKNDREMFTSLPLYLQHGYWFSDGEFIAADGGFEGDGPVRASFKNPGADANKILQLHFLRCSTRYRTRVQQSL